MSVVQLRFATLGVDYIRISGPCSGAAHGPLAVNTPCVFEIKAPLSQFEIRSGTECFLTVTTNSPTVQLETPKYTTASLARTQT